MAKGLNPLAIYYYINSKSVLIYKTNSHRYVPPVVHSIVFVGKPTTSFTVQIGHLGSGEPAGHFGGSSLSSAFAVFIDIKLAKLVSAVEPLTELALKNIVATITATPKIPIIFFIFKNFICLKSGLLPFIFFSLQSGIEMLLLRNITIA